MDILKNPFHILGATPHDNRQKIMDLEEEKGLLSDPELCREARETLINPRKRIAAEIAWLPGLPPNLSDTMLQRLATPNQHLLNSIGLTEITRANLFAAALSRLPDRASSDIAKWILAIAKAAEAIDPRELQTTLNEDRRVSGFPEITDPSAIQDDIRNQKNYYTQAVTATLESVSVPARARILTFTITQATNANRSRPPALIEELILPYERGVQGYLEERQTLIESQDKTLRTWAEGTASDATLQPHLNQLVQTVKEWDTIAQPIQIIKRSRGERHAASFDIAWAIRNLAVTLFIDHPKPDFSRQLLNMLLEVFAEVPEIVERTTEDLKDLERQDILGEGLEKFKIIEAQIKKIKKTADEFAFDSTLAPLVNELIRTLKTWDPSSTRPIETSEGVLNINNVIAFASRDLAIYLWNEHQKLNLSLQITEALIDIFGSIGEINTRLKEDLITLRSIDAREKPGTGCMLQIAVLVTIGVIVALLQGC